MERHQREGEWAVSGFDSPGEQWQMTYIILCRFGISNILHLLVNLLNLYVGVYNIRRGDRIVLYCIDYFTVTGAVSLSGGMTFTLNSGNHFTLTCISTGGPATTVTWTRDSTTVTEGTETVLNNATTAQYTHTLTVNGRVGGLYKCSVANRVSNVTSAELHVIGKQ